MDYNYLQQGGLASLPTHPILGGQQHELSYITPEEAQLLRSYGGGVTPSGGQYTGPGGLPSFVVGMGAGVGSGQGDGGTASAGHGQSSGGSGDGNGGDPSVRSSHITDPYGNTNPDFGLSEGLFSLATVDTAMGDTLSKTVVSDDQSLAQAIADANAEQSIAALENNNINELFDKLARTEPKSMAHQAIKSAIADAMGKAEGEGYSPGAISKANQVAHMNIPDMFGSQTLALSLNNQQFDAMDIANMSDSDFSSLSSNPATTVIGDPESPLGRAIMGSMDIIGLVAPPIGLLSNVISLADTLGLVDMPMGDMGLMSLIGDNISIDGETLSAKASEFGDSIADATGLTSLSDAISDAYGNVKGDVKGLVSKAEQAVSDAWSGSEAQSVATAVGEVPGQVATAVGETFSGLGDVPGQVADSVGDTFSLGDTFSSLGDTFSSLGETSLGDMFSGEGSDIGSGGEGGGPGIQMPVDAISPPPPYVNPTFRTDFEDIEPSSESQIPVTMEDILAKYVSQPKEIISAYSGGGIQGLIDKSNERYSVQNQDRVPSFNKATPHPDLMSGSDGYISNILQGHTVPMGMTNVQQMQKPLEAFPTGGQMNSDNTLHANYSQPQSFYSMPNMNRVN